MSHSALAPLRFSPRAIETLSGNPATVNGRGPEARGKWGSILTMARTPLALPAWASRARLEWIGTVIVLAAALRYWLLYFDRSTNLLDEGSQAAQALRILRGDLIYRDFFTVVTPGSYYTVAGLFQIFGADLMVMRWAVLALGLGICWLALRAARHVVGVAVCRRRGADDHGVGLVSRRAELLLVAGRVLVARRPRLLPPLHLRTPGRPGSSGPASPRAPPSSSSRTSGSTPRVALLLAIWLSLAFDPGRDVRGRVGASARFIGGLLLIVVPVILLLVLAGAGPYLYESWVYYPLRQVPAAVFGAVPGVLSTVAGTAAVHDWPRWRRPGAPAAFPSRRCTTSIPGS